MIALSVMVLVGGARNTVFLDRTFEVSVTEDVMYGVGVVRKPTTSEKPLRLDLYEPKGRNAPLLRPAFIVIHGGGLRRGDKATENMVQLCDEMAARGYVCASINYRLQGDDPAGAEGPLPERTLTAAIDDSEKAIRWMMANSQRYGVDTRRIVVGGSSAGATIALRLGFGQAGRQLHIPVVFSWSGGLYESPSYLDNGTASLFIVHGDDDTDVDPEEVRRLALHAHRAGRRLKTYFCQDLGHNVPLDRRPDGKALYAHMAKFFYTEMELHRIGQKLDRQHRRARTRPHVVAVPCPR